MEVAAGMMAMQKDRDMTETASISGKLPDVSGLGGYQWWQGKWQSSADNINDFYIA